MEATIVNGNVTETGHIIVTTIGGRNGQPKQVCICTKPIFYKLIQVYSRPGSEILEAINNS